ncbi:MAG TPA: response regulator transcription factor [Pseudomonadota bacterium]|jgi:two-component system OmpR family response regulator|nr:response regulator transcription factor [Pseudomonadota bacterium]HND12001.1 response regulator transcription factor [Pseudomonadota bacterium]HNF96279.1 response regulator transcription factor [Pseudomonadota bacterium]HNK43333.1 response regulator transcription factor [Pseudomonadota bacterium]HNN53953.1 response regulator transcription factor [Pseudomonadota bacterium]
MNRILVVDDDGHIRDVMRFALQQGGFQVVEAKDGADALLRFDAGGIDLVVLDIVMPESDGLEVCRRIRAKSRTPIIFVSSRDEELDRVLGLELGADDYLVKPFSPRELLARVKAVLRRLFPESGAPEKRDVQKLGALEMDLGRHRCLWMQKEVILTVTEFALLQSMLGSPGRVFSRGELVDRAYGHGHVITERTVDSHVRRIRQKLSAQGADPIETVYGLGYRLKESL